jgi:alkylation response protein AidB-like acyl-CoA dehydrogenase
MGDNLFTDFPERGDLLKKYSDLPELAMALEETLGDKDAYKNSDEAIEFYFSVLEELGKVASRDIKPTAAEIDRIGAKFKDGKVTLPEALEAHIKKFVEMGLFSGQVQRQYGGYNLPKSVQVMALEILGHACANTSLTVGAYSMAAFIQTFGTEEQKTRILPKIMTNEWRTSMALTEPNAGSDLGKLRSSAVRKGDKWIINGTKQFITSGDGHITFALVRTDPASTGLKGLSVLLVPKEVNGKENYRVAKIEDKVCLHASPTCELVFENSEGELFGTEGEGFKVMAELMNEARLAVSALAVGISTAALEEARNYALERSTMGKPIIQHPMVADMIYEMELEIRGMRSLVIEAAIAYDWKEIYRKKGDEKNYQRWKKRYRRLTPLCKYLCSEKAIEITRKAVQIFGGYGVCRDYPVERLWRESIIYPIYEGTSQIQSLMVLKDTLKDVASQAPGFLGSLAGAWAESKVTRDPVKSRLLEARNELNQGIRRIMLSIVKDKFKSDIDSLRQSKIQQFLREFSIQLLSEKTDLTLPFLYAERFTRITSDYYSLKCLADHMPAGDKEREREVLEYAALVIPRMQLENEYMSSRLPSTLNYMERYLGKA